jgi:hypothetical protein
VVTKDHLLNELVTRPRSRCTRPQNFIFWERQLRLILFATSETDLPSPTRKFFLNSQFAAELFLNNSITQKKNAVHFQVQHKKK